MPNQTAGQEPSASISAAAPAFSAGQVLKDTAELPVNPLGAVSDEWNSLRQLVRSSATNHPEFSKVVGDKMDALQEMLFGGQSAGKPMGTTGGVANEAEILSGAVSGAEEAPEIVEQGAGAAKSAGRAISEAIPSAKRAGEAMGELRKELGDHPVEMTDKLSQSLSRYQEMVDNGNTPSPTVNKLMRRVTDPEKGHLTYNEARDFNTKLGEMTAQEHSRTSPSMRRQIDQVRQALKESTQETTDRAGRLEKFQQSNKEYRNAKKLQAVADWAKDLSVKGVAQKAGAAGALYELKRLLSE